MRRFRLEGGSRVVRSQLSSAPLSTQHYEELSAQVERLRRERWTGVRIAQTTGLSRATVSRILSRLKLNKTRMLERAMPHWTPLRTRRLLATGCMSTSRSWPASLMPGHRLTGLPRTILAGLGLGFLYVAIDELPASPLPPCSPTKWPLPPPLFSARPAATSPTLAHPGPRLRHDRQWTLLLRPSLRSRLPRSSAPTYPHSHLHFRAPTASPNASSRPPSASGPTPVSIRTPPNAGRYLEPPGSISPTRHRPHTALNQKPPITRSGLDVNNLLTHHI